MVSAYRTPRDTRPTFRLRRYREYHQILEHRENHALFLQRSSIAGHLLELSYPLFGIHSIHLNAVTF